MGSPARRGVYFGYLIVLRVGFAGVLVVSAADIGDVIPTLPVGGNG